MAARRKTPARERGFVRTRGRSHQVLVYAGVDPVTGKDSYLTESTTDETRIPEIRTRLLAQVDRQRNAATKATLEYTINAWLEVHEAEDSTIDNYKLLVRRHIAPALGEVPISKIGTRSLEQLYAQLRKCRARCNGQPYIEHRSSEPHDCRTVRHRWPAGRPSAKARAEHDCDMAACQATECCQHECKPLSRSAIRQIHFIISGALSAAVRWEWIPTNPAASAKKPRQTAPEPKPPTPAEAARIATAAWDQDDDWGVFVWLKMLTGARRGELLALHWYDVHFDDGVLEIRRNYTRRNGKSREKDTKTHRIRRIAVDADTIALLRTTRTRYEERCKQLEVEPSEAAYLFSYAPDNSRPCNPDGVSHRYERMCAELGIESHLHTLRPYSATELIGSGVDIRTVAGRLGHAGGGTTTLRVYAAWVAESDKRAAELLAGKMPRRLDHG